MSLATTLLETENALQSWSFSIFDAGRILHISPDKAQELCLEMVTQESLGQISEDFFYVLNSPHQPVYPLERCVPLLRQGWFSYVSFETMLFRYCLIQRPPTVLTMATFGESGSYDFPFGSILFTHVDDEPKDEWYFVRNCLRDSARNIRVAGPMLACEDYHIYRKSGHEEIDEQDLERAIEKYPTYPLPEKYTDIQPGLCI